MQGRNSLMDDIATRFDFIDDGFVVRPNAADLPYDELDAFVKLRVGNIHPRNDGRFMDNKFVVEVDGLPIGMAYSYQNGFARLVLSGQFLEFVKDYGQNASSQIREKLTFQYEGEHKFTSRVEQEIIGELSNNVPRYAYASLVTLRGMGFDETAFLKPGSGSLDFAFVYYEPSAGVNGKPQNKGHRDQRLEKHIGGLSGTLQFGPRPRDWNIGGHKLAQKRGDLILFDMLSEDRTTSVEHYPDEILEMSTSLVLGCRDGTEIRRFLSVQGVDLSRLTSRGHAVQR
jgi:hypothetical protein